jgi:hypothetical protein
VNSSSKASRDPLWNSSIKASSLIMAAYTCNAASWQKVPNILQFLSLR